MKVIIQAKEDEVSEIKHKFNNRVLFDFLNRKYILESYSININLINLQERLFDIDMSFKEIH